MGLIQVRGGADWVSACRKMTALSPGAVMSSPQCGTAFTAPDTPPGGAPHGTDGTGGGGDGGGGGGGGARITAAMCSPAVHSMAANVVAVLDRDDINVRSATRCDARFGCPAQYSTHISNSRFPRWAGAPRFGCAATVHTMEPTMERTRRGRYGALQGP